MTNIIEPIQSPADPLTNHMQQYFYDLAALVQSRMHGSEQFTCWFSAEATDFVRFNQSLIRQPGHVHQMRLSLRLINGKRHAESSATLGGDLPTDNAQCIRMLGQLRAQLDDLPDDPYLLFSQEIRNTEHIVPSSLPSSAAIVDQVLNAAVGTDLVGILAAGPVYRGFANSFGQRNWHQTATFNLDWSLYQNRDKAVKTSYAGLQWDAQTFQAKLASAKAQLALLQRPAMTVKPGAYRVYLTPTALNELFSMLNWSGLSEKSLRTKQSALQRMRDEGLELNPSVMLIEDTLNGVAPGFQQDGFIKPDQLKLLEHGKLTGSMISPRTALEYDIANNGANAEEMTSSLDLAAGNLALANVLAELGTGIFISNLWYLNFSDRANCRITGMTRFATFWVENGKIKAPLNVMRFDDSLFRLLGNKLLGLTQERELLIDGESYGERRVGSTRLPGALISDVNFVL
ncbi:metallopeptidase TldD-related protein [Glaciimonas sp. Gout2]|uniref:TldD/PmbA family protein n=2 Tax=Glaciimonas TaxID=1229970 RepID=UPI002AB3D51B|nr:MULTISPECIES: metallopeptidase TldD-related protein [unclassified Glaciimonas]MDY7544735.1 metallopeptidase TldD-related protein [Glaciimonas sp. CA11.2]MEB0011967.1 metallopeptidase TldD-related protein [Glaciimonas sp. Cout2]MEB0082797.1 metallopeptidase TldD-related protein [Glaciimonas sp. Gout2]